MALRWENPASTTHSLTPSPSNRPLIFWILTPCEKPVATGSAGRCEPGVGRFTDPQPLTCSFFTPYLHCFMFGQCRLPQPSPSPSSEWRIISISIEAIPCFHALPLQARLGLLFPFLPISGFSQPPLSEWRRTGFLSPWVGRCPRIRSQLAHAGPTGPVWGFAGVVPLPRPLTGQKSPHRAEFVFSPQNKSTPPPKGGGAGYHLSWVVGFALLVHNWVTLAQQGRSGASVVRFPTPSSKPDTGPHRGEFEFTAFSWYASFAAVPPTGAPGSS